LTIRAAVGIFDVITLCFSLFVDYLPEIHVHSDKILTNKSISITHISPSSLIVRRFVGHVSFISLSAVRTHYYHSGFMPTAVFGCGV
jgi:hypothetical protein